MADPKDVEFLRGLGFTVFPCAGKRPRVRWQDPEPEGGWAFKEEDNIGVRLPIGTVVADVDDAQEAKASFPFPMSPGQVTQSGGFHVFYRHDDRTPPQFTKRNGTDSRVGGKGYVIAWQPQRWKPVDQWSMAPEWLYEGASKYAAPATDPTGPLRTRSEILSFLGSIASKRKLPPQVYFDMLAGMRERGELVALTSPWTDEDLSTLAIEASKWEPDANPLQSPFLPKAPTTASAPADAGSRPVNIREYLKTVPTDIPWIIEGFVYAGGVTLLSGSPKAGKSTLATEMMRCMETGERFLDEVVHAGPCLLVTEEGGIPVRHKSGELMDLDVYDHRMAGTETFVDTLNKAIKWADDVPRGIIFIDTLAVWAAMQDENAATEVTKALSLVTSLAANVDAGVVLIHHTRKGGGKDGEAIRGSGAMLATVDLSIELSRAGETQRKLELMGRVGLPHSVTIDFDTQSRRYRVIEAGEELSAVLMGVPSDGTGMYATQLEDLWGLKERATQVRIRKLEQSGMLFSKPDPDHRGPGSPRKLYYR